MTMQFLAALSAVSGAGLSFARQTAQDYLDAGLSVLPIRPDGAKAPALKE